MGDSESITDMIEALHPLELKVLPHLKDGTILSDIAKQAGMQEAEVSRALQWLETKGAVKLETKSETEIMIDMNGKKAVEKNFPEMRTLVSAQATRKTHPSTASIIFSKERLEQLDLTNEELNKAVGILKKLNLITNVKQADGELSVDPTPEGESYKTDSYPPFLLLKKIGSGVLSDKLTAEEKKELDSLKKRPQYVIIKERRDKIITLTRVGKELAKTDRESADKSVDFAQRVTPEDIQTGAWQKKTYRQYNVVAPVMRAPQGKEHFVREAIDYVRQIWMEMGFQEMDGDMVQSAFWNLDALFVPQDHPARETQDTFYLDNPAKTTIARNVFDKVKAAHEDGGGTGSKGWRYTFSRLESEKLLLRTHTTVLSAQTLWKIKEGKLPMPGKYFAIGKNFRNEAVDWKHGFEFNQVEGIVVDPNVTFAQLLGYLRIFFSKMGYPNIRLRPHHFPYTEPSVEIDVWHEKREQWVELGGAGMLRPEVTKALLGEDIPVLAWGPGFDRIIMEYFNITDLRDMYKNDAKQLREMKRFIKM